MKSLCVRLNFELKKKKMSQSKVITEMTDAIIDALLSVRGSRPGKKVDLTEKQITFLCVTAKDIFCLSRFFWSWKRPLKYAAISSQFYDLLRLFEYGGFPPESNYLFLGYVLFHAIYS